MTTRISAADLIARLPDILDRVHAGGERFIVEREGAVLAVIQPDPDHATPTLHQLPALLTGVPWPDRAFFDDLEAIHAEMNVPVEPPTWPS